MTAPDEPELQALVDIQARIDAMPAARAQLIAEARAKGHSWARIGEALGMSHVGAMKAAEPTSTRTRTVR